MQKKKSMVTKEVWDEYWVKKKGIRGLFFEKLVSFYRRFLIATQVRIYADQYFSQKGIFLELGSGTCESSSKISKQNRLFGAVDLSANALLKARRITIIDFCIQADIFKLPFKDASIDGIWNVGVMEHFNRDELTKVLKEFNRVLKKNGCCILFWPWIIAPSHTIFGLYEKFLGLMGIRKKVFPEPASMFKSSKTVAELLKRAGFKKVKFHLPFFDFTHVAVVGRMF
jgi:ubiquinone/menaquinone biosynthesis C-methylase UbiE